MRGSRAKRLRTAEPYRPNPGRKFGGTPKVAKKLLAELAALEAAEAERGDAA